MNGKKFGMDEKIISQCPDCHGRGSIDQVGDDGYRLRCYHHNAPTINVLDEIRTAWLTDRVATHWTTCYTVHYECAIRLLLDIIERDQ